MKRLGITLSLLTVLLNPIFAQSEAGAIFLLIAPGARAGGMGEAQVAVANDAYASSVSYTHLRAHETDS